MILFLIVFSCLVLLILLITWGRLNAFLAFLVIALLTGFLLGIPVGKIVKSVQNGIGDTLGSLAGIIVLGAMLGKLVAVSGAAQRIASTLMNRFGKQNVQWALMVAGFIIGIPLFYNIGFVLMVPLIFTVAYEYKLPAVYLGLPMLAALSVTHGFLPPHPSPTALVQQFKATMGLTLVYGVIIAIPAIVIAGPLFSLSLKNITGTSQTMFKPHHEPDAALPGIASSFITALLPVFLLLTTTFIQLISKGQLPLLQPLIQFITEPLVIMLLSVLVAIFTLGISRGYTVRKVMDIYGEATKDIAMIILIIAGAGALKQVLADSGVSQSLAAGLQTVPIHPLILGWLMAAVIRASIGSATIAGLTAAGIIFPLMEKMHTNPNLMVLAVGAGSLMFSHVNDAGFWMFKEYFNLSLKNTFRTWSVMEVIVSLVGLAGVLILNLFVT